jgi:hypothetical protein
MKGMVMKAKKALKRLAKIEALMSGVAERYSASATHVREVLQDAKTAVIRAKEAVSLQASSGTSKHPPVKHSEPTSKATPEPSKPKRELSAAGRKAIIAATKKRWAAFHLAKQAEEPEPAVPKKADLKKTARKKTAKKAPTKVAVHQAAPKKSTPAKKAKGPVKKAAKKPSPVTAQSTAVAESAPTAESSG